MKTLGKIIFFRETGQKTHDKLLNLLTAKKKLLAK